jgi:3-oxoadipate enol-lactonase
MSSVIDVDDASVGWREAGAEGEVVLLLHGLGGSRTSWEPQLRTLSRSRRVVAWDQPGYGVSAPLAETTFPALAGAAVALLDRLEIGRAHLVGLSFGGMVAQHVALEHPERVHSLALLSTSPAFGLDGTSPDDWREARLSGLVGRSPADVAEPVLRGIAGSGIDDAALAEQCAAMARIPAEGLRAAIACIVTHDTRARLGELAVPTLVAVGEHDDETPPAYARALADGIAGARLEVVPEAGHLLNAEAPTIVNALLSEHFDRVEVPA